MKRRWSMAGVVAFYAVTLFTNAHAQDKPKITPYGFVRLDAIYDDSRMQNPQFAQWVESEGPGNIDDSELTIHPRLSRLGVKLEPYAVSEAWQASGTVEIDFQNGGSESRATPRMRHAFVQFTSGSFEGLLGQTWDLVAPLIPAANNDAILWNAGNPGDRRPQARVTYHPALGGGHARLAVSAGMATAVSNQDLDANGQLDGLDAAVPAMQALAEVEGGKVVAGVWGHVSEEEVTLLGENEQFTAALLGGHLKITPTDAITIQGEGFWGQNAADVRAGIGQSINVPAQANILTRGGWGELGWKLSPKYTITAGGSIDQPHEEDVPDGGRRKNHVVYVVQHLRPWSRTTFGLEYLNWATFFVNRPAGHANRVDLHVTYSF